MGKHPRKTLGYCRVSTEEQAREGVSLEAQEEQIRRYCDLYSLELVEVLRDEGVSGKSMERPGMVELMSHVEAGEVQASGLSIQDFNFRLNSSNSSQLQFPFTVFSPFLSSSGA